MSATATVIPFPVSQPLHAVEDTLAAFFDTFDGDTIGPDQEAEFLADLGAAMAQAVSKRDAVGGFMAHLDAQIAAAEAEIERLASRKERYEAALDRMTEYVIHVIEALGPDSKGKPRKLEGNTVTFSLKKCPPSVIVADDARIPEAYKQAAVRMPAEVWAELLDALDLDMRARIEAEAAAPNYTVNKMAVKKAIAAGMDVPGADVAIGKHTLIRR